MTVASRSVLLLATALFCCLALAASAMGNPPSASRTSGVVVPARLTAIAESLQSWATTPTLTVPDRRNAQASVSALLAQTRDSHHQTLHAGLGYLRWLLELQPSGSEQRSALALETYDTAAGLAAESTGDSAPAEPQARAAQTIGQDLFRARWDLLGGDPEAAQSATARARLAFARSLAPALGGSGTAARALSLADSAIIEDDDATLAEARGQVLAAIATGAYRLTLKAIAERRPATAWRWAQVRDWGATAGSSTIDDGAVTAQGLSGNTLVGAAAALALRRDQLDDFQRRTLALVQKATLSAMLGLGAERAQAAAQAFGYWQVLAPIYAQSLGGAAESRALKAFATLRASNGYLSGPARGNSALRLQSAGNVLASALGAFTAAPLTPGERQQRVEQLVEAMRFTSARLCGGAYMPRNGEPEGTVAGPPVVTRLVAQLRPGLDAADAARLTQAGRALAQLPGASGSSGEDLPKTYRESQAIRSACALAAADIRAVFPNAWGSHGDNADFERIGRALARVQAEAEHGEWAAAAATAREAYATFDLTPELRLMAVEPALAAQIEALFWNGGVDGRSLFAEISDQASIVGVHRVTTALEAALARGEIVLESSHSATAVAVNSGIVVFREGLEALLIVAALSAGFVTAGSRWRRPAIMGAVVAAPATLITWLITSAVLRSLSSFGLQLQAVLDLGALAVLTVMLAWFFQKFCWTRFVAREQARHRRVLGRASMNGALAPSLGLFAVGFAVIYREGFEAVLYLQALRVQAGAGAVVEGVLVGSVFTAVAALLMLRLRRRLPYRAVVVATACLIGVLTVTMTGQAMRSLQAVGWLAVTPVHFDIPVWAGQWLGLYPSLQTLLAQLLCAIAIAGGAVLSEWLRTRRLRRRMALARARSASRRASARTAARPLDPAMVVDDVRAGRATTRA